MARPPRNGRLPTTRGRTSECRRTTNKKSAAAACSSGRKEGEQPGLEIFPQPIGNWWRTALDVVYQPRLLLLLLLSTSNQSPQSGIVPTYVCMTSSPAAAYDVFRPVDNFYPARSIAYRTMHDACLSGPADRYQGWLVANKWTGSEGQ